MLKWIIAALLVAIILGLYFYTSQTKEVIDAAINLFR